MGTEKRERQRQNRAQKLQEDLRIARRRKARSGAIRWVAIAVALVVVVAGIAFFASRGGDDTDPTLVPATDVPTASTTAASPSATTTQASAATEGFAYGTGECAPAEKPAEPVREFTDAPQQCIDPAKQYTATFATSEGDIAVELDAEAVPGTVNNFVNLARFGYYDDTPIFRIATSIGIFQGGGPDARSSPGYTIPDEGSGFSYTKGDLAMARKPTPDSASAQWFFGATDAIANLDGDGTYVRFGRITEGLDVAEAIFALAPDDGGETPTRDVALESVTIDEA